MRNNILIKLICSIPVILIAGYFSKILCILLIIFRLIAVRNSKYTLPSTLVIIGLVLLIPKGLSKLSLEIPYLNDIITSDLYPKLLSYSKFLLIFGVVLLLITYVINLACNSISNNISSYINKQEEMDREIKEKNDYKMRLKQEESKYTRVVKCPNCGANNTLTDKTGKCSHCRSSLG